MDEIDWEALLDQMPTIVVLTEDESRKLAMRTHPSAKPAFLSAAMN